MVVEAVPRAERVLAHTIMLAFPYTYLERIRFMVAAEGGEVLDEDFTGEVTLTARLRVEKLPGFQSGLSELTNGKIQAEVIETKDVLLALE
jgi:putative IMPACT (imprinted ancient) family translation regulator